MIKNVEHDIYIIVIFITQKLTFPVKSGDSTEIKLTW